MARKCPPKGFRGRSQEAFSLTELVIAAVIVAVLLGLLFPAIRSAMQASAGAKCAGNLKQIGQAVHARAADTGDLIPAKEWIPQPDNKPALGGNIWRNLLVPYLPINARWDSCPAEPKPFLGYTKYTHFGWNTGTSSSNRPFKKVLAIKNPSKLFLMADSNQLAWQLVPHDGTGAPMTPDKTGGFVFRHHNRANCLFFDGHIEALALQDLPSISTRWTAPYNAFWTGD